MKGALSQLLRYGVLGVFLNALGYSFYLLLTFSGISPFIVVVFLYPVMAVVSFLANRRWAFGFQGAIGSNFLRFLVAHIGGIALNVGLLYLFTSRLGFPHQWVQAGAIFIVAAYLFLVFRYYVYNGNRQHDLEQPLEGSP